MKTFDPFTGKLIDTEIQDGRGGSVNFPGQIASSGSSSSVATSASPTIFNGYGLSPDDVTKRFGSAYSKATEGYDPFPGAGARAGITRLEGEYGKVPQAFDVTDTIRALTKAREANMTVNTQAANNAANRYAEQAGTGASSSVGSAMIRAKSLLPALQADYQGAGEEGKYRDSAKEKALTTAAGIAESLAKLEMDYTNSLANYNSGKAQFGMNYANAQTGLALDASSKKSATNLEMLRLQQEANMHKDELGLESYKIAQAAADASWARQAAGSRPGAAGVAASLTGGGGRPDMFPGYIPNAGPITPARVNGKILPNQYLSPDAITALGGRLSGAMNY